MATSAVHIVLHQPLAGVAERHVELRFCERFSTPQAMGRRHKIDGTAQQLAQSWYASARPTIDGYEAVLHTFDLWRHRIAHRDLEC